MSPTTANGDCTISITVEAGEQGSQQDIKRLLVLKLENGHFSLDCVWMIQGNHHILKGQMKALALQMNLLDETLSQEARKGFKAYTEWTAVNEKR